MLSVAVWRNQKNKRALDFQSPLVDRVIPNPLFEDSSNFKSLKCQGFVLTFQT